MKSYDIGHFNVICPMCNAHLVGRSRTLGLHAKLHGISSEELYMVLFCDGIRPTCSCRPECAIGLTWQGWTKGFNAYAVGHYDSRVRSNNTKEALKKSHWSRGLTKNNDQRLIDLGKKCSVTLKNRFSSGELKHWAKDKTKASHPSIASRAKKLSGRKFHLYEANVVQAMILDRLRMRFVLLTSFDEINGRDNNKTQHVRLRCTRCQRESYPSIYNVIRKQDHFCRTCDVRNQWTSKGENELADTLIELYGKIEHPAWVNGWSIDVYVPAIMTYFQFDGVYWHGLDRSLEDIIDPKIVRKFHRDIEQNQWFASMGLKLVRITDLEWNKESDKFSFLSKKLAESDWHAKEE